MFSADFISFQAILKKFKMSIPEPESCRPFFLSFTKNKIHFISLHFTMKRVDNLKHRLTPNLDRITTPTCFEVTSFDFLPVTETPSASFYKHSVFNVNLNMLSIKEYVKTVLRFKGSSY